MNKAIPLTIWISNLTLIYATSICCNATNNYIMPSLDACEDGKPLNKMACDKSFGAYADDNETVYHVDETGALFLDGEKSANANEYCFSTVRSTNQGLYVICLNEDTEFVNNTNILNTVLQIISIFFIVLTVAIYVTLPQMLDLQGLCIIHSISGLATGFLVMTIVNFGGYLKPELCHLAAYSLYVSLLYAFFWLNVLCFHIWRLAFNPNILQSIKRWKIVYHLYGCGGPVVLLILLALINHLNMPQLEHVHPGIGEVACWFKSLRETLIYFYLPISILLLVNICLFIWTATVLWIQCKTCPKTKVLKYRLRLYIKLFFIMGITWVFEVISVVLMPHTKHIKWIWIFTDSLNGLEGLIIFLILVVFRKKVVRSLANRKIFSRFRFPAAWRHVRDSECELEEAEISLSTKH